MEWNGMEFREFASHISEQEFFVFCFIRFHYSARFRTRVFCILLHSLPSLSKIPNKSFLYFDSFASIIRQDSEQEFFVF